MAKKAASLTLDKATDNIGDYLQGTLTRAAKIRGYLNRVVYPAVLKKQATRWQSENVSEGARWDQLKDQYLNWRKKVFPNSGEKILVRTGDLAKSMTAADKANHFKMVTNKTLETGSLIDYAGYVDDTRTITEFSDETVDEFVDGLEDYLMAD